MKKRVTLFITSTFFCANIFAQSISINQSQQQSVNINLPVIEKKVYVDRYRTVYVEKPRTARKLSAPVQLLGYLWVYPEDLGTFNQVPTSVIANINAQSPYGRNNWRIPTPDELAVLEANAEKVGLGNDIYLATDHRNGVLRLVSTGQSIAQSAVSAAKGDYIMYAGTKWATKNDGASSPYKEGIEYDFSDMLDFVCPSGWRLPTVSEFKKLASIDNYQKFAMNQTNWAYYGGLIYNINGKSLIFPQNVNLGGYYWCINSNGNLTRCIICYDNTVYQEDARFSGMVRLVQE